MEPDLNTSPQKTEIKHLDGYENWSMDDKQKFEDDIQKLESLGIKVEIVEAQMGLAMYDETDKTLKIRQDADADFVVEYIQNTIFKEQDGVDQLPDTVVEDLPVENVDGSEDDQEEGEGDEEGNRVFGGADEENTEPQTEPPVQNIVPEPVIPEPAVVIPEPIPVTPEPAPTVSESEVISVVPEENVVEKLTQILADKGFRVYRPKENQENNWQRSVNKFIKALEMAGISSATEAGFDIVSPSEPIWDIGLNTSKEGNVSLRVPWNTDVNLLSEFIKYAPHNLGDNGQVMLEDFIEEINYIPQEFENENGLIIKAGDYIKWTNDGGSFGQGTVESLSFSKSGAIKYVEVNLQDGKTSRVYINDITAVTENVPPVESELTPVIPEAEIKTEPESEPEPAIDAVKEINEAIDKNGEVIKIGDKVGWDFYGGSGNGRITSFVSRNSTVLANIYSDTAKELEIDVKDIFLAKEPEKVEIPIVPSPEVNNKINSEEEDRKRIEANYVPEWQNGEDWAEFERSRAERAKAEIVNRKDESFGSFVNALGHGLGGLKKGREKMTDSRNLRWDTQDDYNDQKNNIAHNIRETFRKNAGENLTPEQEADLQSKINDKIFEELVQKENDAYLSALKEARGETKMGKVIESAKSLLGTKTMQWYLGLSRKQRMALSFGVGSIAGLAFGATVAPGAIGMVSYLAWRAARVGLAGTAGMKAGEWANKKWSAEELEMAKNKEVEDLKNSDLPLKEKSQGFEDIEKRYKKEKIKITLKKMGTTIAAGAGTGLLTGLAEHAVMGAGGVTKEALESRGGKTDTIQESRLARRGFEPSPVKTSIPEQAPEPTVPKVATPEVAASEAEKLFEDPSILKHEVEAGDSTWKILKGTLENNEQFKGMTEAQKTYVLSNLTNKVLQNPENYGLNKAGSLNIGDKTDFTKLFENTKEVNGVFAKAKETIMEGSAQEKSILLNNEKIAAWVEAHPNESLNEGRVTEILNSKPEVKVAPVPEATAEVPTEAPVTEPEPVPQAEPEPQPEANNVTEMVNEIEEAKKRLQVLEGGRGMRSMMGDISAEQGVEKAFRDEINSIYEQSGFLGLGKVPGINTKEWGEMARLPASKVVEYYTGDSAKSGLPNDILEKLTKSKNHNALMRQTAGLMEQANGAVKPFENENMEQFIKRLGGYVLRTYSQNLPKAA